MTKLRILSPGLHTTVQDLGRFGVQHLGIPVSGAFDSINLRLANCLVQNEETVGALEMIAQGAAFEVLAESVRCAIAAPDARVELIGCEDPAVIKAYQSFTLKKGDQFQIRIGRGSSVCYLAIEGGLKLPVIMGSQSTFVLGEMGGFKGRKLAKDDEIELNQASALPKMEMTLPNVQFTKQHSFRIMLGPQDDYFKEEMIESFLQSDFTISHQSDRMGFRLSGFKLEHSKDFNIASDGIAPGAIQVPGSGEPIILLADRQTTGGYPKIGVVISADLPALGRLGPGETISFKKVDFHEARQAAHALQAWLSKTRHSIAEARTQSVIDQKALLEQNLIDGVVNAQLSQVE